MSLPQNNKLPISRLAGIFSNTTATYKFYWFVALLDCVVKERKTQISFWEIIAGMVAESWYPIHYFKLSFGKSDSLFDKSLEIQNAFQISIESDKDKVRKYLLDNLNGTKKFLRVFTLNVPYRFLSPWIKYTYDEDVVEKIENSVRSDAEKEEIAEEYDSRLEEAVEIVIEAGQASVSMLQRRMRVGYARAGRLIDEMERRGIVSEADGAKPRTVLINREQFMNMFSADEA
jgi:DNA segregation ATPase FtsK/SpoIIIE-like protein